MNVDLFNTALSNSACTGSGVRRGGGLRRGGGRGERKEGGWGLAGKCDEQMKSGFKYVKPGFKYLKPGFTYLSPA